VLDGYLPPLLVIALAFILIRVRLRYAEGNDRGFTPADVAIIAAIIGFAGFLEIEMGRTPTYKYGPVRLWSGDIHSNQNSQQIADPYTFTHVIHGAIFYGLTRIALRSSPLALRAIIGITAESAWEVLENTDMVIRRYRAATISLDYYGDSVLNSVSDILACVVGFVLAWRLPARVTVIWILSVELILALWIRDNLTLNILMLLYPVKAIQRWQLGAG
jgi:hypothetical protein